MKFLKSTDLVWKKFSKDQMPEIEQIVFVVTLKDYSNLNKTIGGNYFSEWIADTLHEDLPEELGLSKPILKPMVFFNDEFFYSEEDDYEPDDDEGFNFFDFFGEEQYYLGSDYNPEATYYTVVDTKLTWEEMREELHEAHEKMNTMLDCSSPYERRDPTVVKEFLFLKKGSVPIVEWDEDSFVCF